LWCLLFLFVTQVLTVFGVVFVMVLFHVIGAPKQLAAQALRRPDEAKAFVDATLGPLFLVAEISVIGFSLVVIRLVMGRDWPRLVALRRPGFVHVLLALAALPALIVLADGAYEVAKQCLPGLDKLGLPGMEEMVNQFSSWHWAFAVLVIGVGPGIGEELWCRAFLGRGLVGHYGLVVGVLLTSFYFGFIHIDPQQGSMAMLMGIALHYIYQTTRSLYVPMLLHFGNNAMGVLLPNVPRWRAFAQMEPGEKLHIYGVAILLAAAVAWALYQGRARLRAIDPDRPLWQPAYPGVEHPPPGSGTIVHRPLPSAWTCLTVLVGVLAFGAVFLVTYLNLPVD
jgi:membrane protease YdiL (CAAX protease family)